MSTNAVFVSFSMRKRHVETMLRRPEAASVAAWLQGDESCESSFVAPALESLGAFWTQMQETLGKKTGRTGCFRCGKPKLAVSPTAGGADDVTNSPNALWTRSTLHVAADR